ISAIDPVGSQTLCLVRRAFKSNPPSRPGGRQHLGLGSTIFMAKVNRRELGQLESATIMAGHSKWAKVKHFKGAVDAKRSRIFAKLSKEISIAAKIAGGDPNMNPRLRMVLLKCRQANMPSDNIERAIKRGVGGEGAASYEDLTYEIYGPGGVAFLVEL